MIIIAEETTPVELSRRELSLIIEISTEFLLSYPEATDAEALMQKIMSVYHAV